MLIALLLLLQEVSLYILKRFWVFSYCILFEIEGEETWVYFADPDGNVLEYIQWYN